MVDQNGTAKVRPVTVRQEDDRQAVIASGVTASEMVVTSGFGRLADGTKVEVASAEDAGQGPAEPAPPPRPRGGAPKGNGQRAQLPAAAPATTAIP